MARGGVLQRDAREIYNRIDAVGEAAADLLVNTEDSAPHVNMKSLYHSLLRNSRSGRHSESFFQLPSSNGEYGSRAA